MRFKEFFIEATTPVVSATPKPGYLGYKVDNKVVWAHKSIPVSDINAAIEADPSVLDVAQPDFSRSGTTTNAPASLKTSLAQAKTVADNYLGRPLADYEWDSLLRVSYAEAAHNAEEQAWVMASVLNSVRMFNNTVYHEISKTNRMQSVTGPKGNRVASPNFTNAINQQGLSEILAAIKILPTVPKSIVHFTAADEKAYQQGTSTGWKTKLMTIYQGTKAKVNPPNIWGKIVGKSVFSTDFTDDDFLKIRTSLTAKATKAKPANKFIAKPNVKPVPEPVKKPAQTTPNVPPKAPQVKLAAKAASTPTVGKKL